MTSDEGCRAYDPVPGVRYVLMLRDPISHILSMFFHCSTSDYAREQIQKAHGYHLSEGNWERELNRWLDSNLASNKGGDKVLGKIRCWNPRDYMSKYVACSHKLGTETHTHGPTTANVPPDLGTNLTFNMEALGHLYFYGFQDLYAESVARLCAKLNERPYVKNSLRGMTNTTGKNHGVESHSRWRLNDETLEKMRSLARGDMDLYIQALLQWG